MLDTHLTQSRNPDMLAMAGNFTSFFRNPPQKTNEIIHLFQNNMPFESYKVQVKKLVFE